jgi:DNA-binding MarR family transcriptional regulator
MADGPCANEPCAGEPCAGEPCAEPRWLSAEEQEAWRALLAVIRHITTSTNKQLGDEAGLPHGYYQILAMLSEAENRTLRMSQLADLTMTSPSRMSHAVKALEARGWIERSSIDSDRRGHVARLTDEGFATLVALAPGHVAEVRRTMFDRLTPQQVTQLAEISRAILPKS